MNVKRMDPESYPFDLTNPNEVRVVTFIWAKDGWCYIPELHKRQRFYIQPDVSILTLVEEPWLGVIPQPLNLEKVKQSLFSVGHPRIWMEETPGFSELYVEQPAIQSKSK
jgi:hypothetical protein